MGALHAPVVVCCCCCCCCCCCFCWPYLDRCSYSYNYIVEDDVAYLCVATMDIPTRMCFGFLSKIKNLYDGGEEFDAVLEEQMVGSLTQDLTGIDQPHT